MNVEWTHPAQNDQQEYDILAEQSATNPYLSPTFKIWIVGVIFFLVFFHLSNILVFPKEEAVPTEWFLAIALALIGYLWVQEVRDKNRVEAMNQALVEAHAKLQEAEIATITSLVLMEEAKDAFLHGHSDRVTRFSLAIAEALDFSKGTKDVIRRAAMLHDLGWIAIKDEIMFKPGKFTDEEWAVVKQHPQIAVDMLKPLKFLFLEKKIILHHHERVDGTGYPKGLKDKEIPLESRIIAVADTFDAMNSTRIYREPCTKDYIISELRRVAGTQLDTTLVPLFLELLEQNPQFWERS